MTRREATAVAISIAVHAALGAFAWTRVVPPAPRPPARETVRIDLVSPPKPPPPAPATPPKKSAPALKHPAPPIARAPPPSAEAPPPPETPIVKAPETPKLPAPTEPPKKIDLFAPSALAQVTRGLTVPKTAQGEKSSIFGKLPGEAAGEEASTEADRVAQRVVGTTIDQTARARVRAGIVDPRYTKLGRAILDAWDPDRALPETSAELWAKRRAQNTVIAAKLWQEAGSTYARTGSPFAEGETLDEAVRTDLRPVGQPTGLGDQQNGVRETYRQYMKGKFNEGRSALVLVELGLDQSVKVSLVKTSGDLDVDRAALDDIRAAMEWLKADGVALGAGKSLWSMRLQIIINPPLPIASFTFDEVLESPKLELPLGRKLLKRVQLEAVYDDDPRLSHDGAGGP